MQNKSEESRESANILYWSGILDPMGLIPAHKQALEKLMEGNYHGLNFEKLVGHDVYSIRLNDADRLLFTTIMVQGKRYLMLLDEVLNHDYAKSRFLKPGVLKNYLELHGKAIAEELLSSHFESCSQDTIPLSGVKFSTNPIEYSRIDFHNQKFIVLDGTQLEVATKKTFPLIISGAPGSGKSCIALLILGQYVELNTDDDYPILYVTESERLANSMRCSWHALPIAQNLAADAVQFKSYQQLVTTLCPETANKMFVSKEHCKKWLIDYIKDNRIRDRATKKTTLSNVFFDDTEAMFQELRIISGCLTKADYLGLGQKQSLFHEGAEKKWLFDAYTDYQEKLGAVNCIYAPFYPLNLKDPFKLVVVDEAQDLSPLQLRTLSNIASNRQICFCEDNRQSLSDNKSKIPFIHGLMHSWGMPDNDTTLSTSYRCPEAVITQVNMVSHVASMVTGYGQPEIVIPEGQTNKGTVTWLAPGSEQEFALSKVAFTTNYAIVTLAEHKEEAQNKFNTFLVFTPGEIKGLEYQNIIGYRLFDNRLFKKIDKLLGGLSPEFSKKTGNRAKKNQGNEQYGPLINAIFTAFTRATENLYIVQEKHHYLAHIWEALTSKVLPVMQIKPEAASEHQDSTQNWLDEVRRQLIHSNDDVAENIYRKNLDKSAAEFKEFKAHFLNQEQVVNPVNVAERKPIAKIKPALTVHPVKNNASKSRPVTIRPVPTSTARPSNNSPSNSKHGDLDEKICALLEKIEVPNMLLKFLKDPKAEDYLYTIPVNGEDCLFRTLFYTKGSRDELLFCLLKHPKLLERGITKDILCRPLAENRSPLYYLLLTPNGLKVLNRIYVKNKGMIEGEDFDSLCFVAAERGDVSVINELIKYKANLGTPYNNGMTPAYIAAQNNHISVIAALATHDVSLLSIYTSDGATPAYIAAQNNNVSVITELAKHDMSLLNICTKDGATTAYVAAQNGRVKVIEALIKLGVDLSRPYVCNVEILRMVAKYQSTEISDRVNQFIWSQQVTSNEQMLSITPYDIASIMGYENILPLLLPYEKANKKPVETVTTSSYGFFSTDSQITSPPLKKVFEGGLVNLREAIAKLKFFHQLCATQKYLSHYAVEQQLDALLATNLLAIQAAKNIELLNEFQILKTGLEETLKKLKLSNKAMIKKLDFETTCIALIHTNDIENLGGLIQIGEDFGTGSKGEDVYLALYNVYDFFRIKPGERNTINKPCLDRLSRVLNEPPLALCAGNIQKISDFDKKLEAILKADAVDYLMAWLVDAKQIERDFALRRAAAVDTCPNCLLFLLHQTDPENKIAVINLLALGQPSGQIALHRAIKSGKAISVSILLNDKLNPSNDLLKQLLVCDNNGLTPVDWLEQRITKNNSPECFSMLEGILEALANYQNNPRFSFSMQNIQSVNETLKRIRNKITVTLNDIVSDEYHHSMMSMSL